MIFAVGGGKAIDTGKVLQALSLGDHLPELSLDNIPISITTAQTTVPVVSTPTPAAPAIFSTVVPTATPTAAPTTPQIMQKNRKKK